MSAWEKSDKIINTFNSKNKRIESIIHQWRPDLNTWVNHFLSTYLFNSDDKITNGF